MAESFTLECIFVNMKAAFWKAIPLFTGCYKLSEPIDGKIYDVLNKFKRKARGASIDLALISNDS